MTAPGAASVFVASVWLVHGFYNKLMGGSVRHLQIIQATPGLQGATGEWALVAVGVAEICVAAWVITGLAPYLCAACQTAALLSMNVVELAFARDLLLWPAGLLPINAAFLILAWVAAGSRRRTTLRTVLKRHPIAVVARFRECLTLTYALPADVLRPLLPPGLELDTWRGHGFVAVALVQSEALRPAGLARPLGQDFFLAGYRVFVTYRTPEGRRLRGLRILRSDADRLTMVAGGNLFTHYNYHPCEAAVVASPDGMCVTVRTPDGAGDVALAARAAAPTPPAGSPFASWREARRFAGPLPFTFDYEAETHSIVAIEARRTNWAPQPADVAVLTLSFLEQPMFRGAVPVLAAAFRVSGIDYRWERGRRYPLPAPHEAAS